MKQIIWLLSILIIGISTNGFTQDIPKDSTSTKDTTFIKKLGTLAQTVLKDTIPRAETKKDTILEKKLEKGFYSFRQFEHETFLFAETPARWHKTDWLRVGLVLTATIAIMPFDKSLSNVTQSAQSYYSKVPVIIGRIYGAWYFSGIISAAAIGYGIFTHNKEAEKIDIELLQAGIYSDLISGILKLSLGRASPYEYQGPYSYHPFNKFNSNFESMPSGDAALAFALSTITSRHTHSTLIKILAFVPAAFTLFSRIYQNEQWASDEFLGAAIGFCTGEWVVNLHEGKRHKINIPTDY